MILCETVLSLGLAITMLNVPTLVWAIYAGLVLGTLVMYYNKAVLGKGVRAILEQGAIEKDKARTAEELGFAKNPFILHSIEKGALSRYIHRTRQEDASDDTLGYYITEEDRIRAELRYSSNGSDLYVVIISIVLLTLVAFLLSRYLPELLSLAKGLIE